MILPLNPKIFNAEDAEILKRILAGEKYESIAKHLGIKVNTLKKRIGKLYKNLAVGDKTIFMANFANHQIILEDLNNTVPAASEET